MDVAESRRLKDVESLKTQLKNAKQQMEETLRKTESLKVKLKEEKLQFSKTFNNLQKTQSEQNLKIAKLCSDIKNYENLYINQMSEKNNFLESINKLNEELENLTKESEKQISEKQKLCLELDKEVKCGFVKCQRDQEMVVLWELGRNFTSAEEYEAFKRVFIKIKAEADRRFNNFKQELCKMDETLIRLREEIRQKRERYSLAEAKYLALKGMPEECVINYKILEELEGEEKVDVEEKAEKETEDKSEKKTVLENKKVKRTM